VLGDQYFIPGVGKMGGVFVQIIGAETLKTGKPIDLGWLPTLLLGVALTAFAITQRKPAHRSMVLGIVSGVLLVTPIWLDDAHIFISVVPALFVILTVWSVLGWRGLRKRGLINPVSNLPNLNALRVNRDGRKQALIAARVLNYEEIAATLPTN